MSFIEIKPLMVTGEHSYHRRALAHNYFAPFIYHIILKKAPTCEVFGSVAGDAMIKPGETGSARIIETELGRTIAKALIHLPFEFPSLKLLQFCVMPDHVHILLQVVFDSGKHLDYYMDNLVNRIVARYSEKKGLTVSAPAIFEPGYCDKPLYDDRSLGCLFRYIRENPHRLAMRLQFPQFFQRVNHLKIGDKEYEAYGNLFLLRNPDKEAVKISRRFTREEIAKKKAQWLAAAEKGTVLVSPFISPLEKAIRKEAEDIGSKTILIVPSAFFERYKPYAHDFDLCSQGRLLIISFGMPPGTPLSRECCLQMNELASAIAANSIIGV